MSDQHRLGKLRLTTPHPHIRTQPGQRRQLFFLCRLQRKGYQSSTGWQHLQTELTGDVVSKAGCTHCRNRQSATGHHHGFTTNHAGRSAQTITALHRLHLINGYLQRHFCAGPFTLTQQHIKNVTTAIGAEQLPRRLLDPVNAMPLNQLKKLLRGVALQSGNTEVRISGNKICRRAIKIGEIAAAAAGHQNFFTCHIGMIEDTHTAAAIGSH